MPLHCIIIAALLVTFCRADITNENPATGTCLCLDADSVNVRATACGNVIGSTGRGNCFAYRGGKVGCTLSGTFYQFFETDFGGTSGWIAGDFLVIGTDSQCGNVAAPDVEFRSVFIATAWNVDWPTSSANSPAQQQTQMITYLNTLQNTNMNAVVFQVRPVGDAVYNSNIEPWSRFLTGTQGVAPSPLWDPLSFTVQEAHARGIEVHAWLNPYRANLSPNWIGLASNHMANVYPQYAYPYSTYLWMDPGAQVVVDHLVNVIVDIITRYDVDGIHFDDYFYPYPDGTQFPDTATYNAYVQSGGLLPRDDWRRDNVNRMIQRVYSTIKDTKPSVKFSISPFGIYRPGNAAGMPPPIAGLDPYTQLYADSKYWLQQGWLDFFAPQLYWAINPPAQSYPTLLDWWLNNNPLGRNIYGANGVYKMEDSNNWPVSEIENQIAISRDSGRRAKYSFGNIMYSAKFFRDNLKGITDAFRTRVYTNKAVTPAMPWLGLELPDPPKKVTIVGNIVSWEKTESAAVRWWIVVKKESSKWNVINVLEPSRTSIVLEPGAYYVSALNAASQFSAEIMFNI